jgi:4-amino-4-deoxy-L-arabinose transferase-like glycosyltransferase
MVKLSQLWRHLSLEREEAGDRVSPLLIAALAIVLVGLGIFYFRFTGTLIEINDEAGSLYSGLQIAETGAPNYDHPYNQLIGPYFTLNAFRVQRAGDPRFYVIYPPGYPLMIALARRLFPGWEQSIFFVSPLLALVAALGAYGLGRALHRPRTGLWAALLLLIDPVTIANGTRAFSDIPALACILLGYALLVKRGRSFPWVQGAAIGLCFGYACLIRNISAIALAGVAVWALLNWTELKQRWRMWLAMALSFGLLAAAALLYNRAYFGGLLTTGYTPEHYCIPYPLFSWQNFLGHSPIRPGGYRAVLETIGGDLEVVGLLAAALGLFLLPRRASLALGLTALLFALAYAAYAWPASGGGSRFLLPTLAILRVLAAVGLEALLSLWRRHRRAALALGLAVIVLLQGRAAVDAFRAVGERNADTAGRVAVAKAVAAQTAANSVFVARRYSDHLILYGHRAALLLELFVPRKSGRYYKEEFAPRLVSIVSDLLQKGIPVYAIEERSESSFLDPMPVLREDFVLVLCPPDFPKVYRVWPAGTKMQALLATCWVQEGGQ